jgi:RNA polymerase sigma-70 factor (ECF subfamily)
MAPPPLLTGFAFALITLTIAWLAWRARAAMAPSSSVETPWAPWASGSWCASEGGNGSAPEPGLTNASLKALRPSILRWVVMRGVPDRDIEDVVQNVLKGAWESRDTYTPGAGSLSTWLYIITRNHVTNYLARAHVRREVLTADPLEDTAAADDDLEGEAVMRQEAAHAAGILDRIPQHLADTFVEHDIEDAPMVEIAPAHGLPLSTAWSRLGQARRAIGREVSRVKARRR